jgi:putative endonuclease
MYRYCVYITTNINKTVLYVGSSSVPHQRLTEHYLNRGKTPSFAGRYHAYWLIYYEIIYGKSNALSREYQIKGWSRKKKEALIATENPEWKFLNTEILDEWPPKGGYVRRF